MYSVNSLSKAKQSKAKQSKAKQSKAKPWIAQFNQKFFQNISYHIIIINIAILN